jgi:hypothetical protein
MVDDENREGGGSEQITVGALAIKEVAYHMVGDFFDSAAQLGTLLNTNRHLNITSDVIMVPNGSS